MISKNAHCISTQYLVNTNFRQTDKNLKSPKIQTCDSSFYAQYASDGVCRTLDESILNLFNRVTISENALQSSSV